MKLAWLLVPALAGADVRVEAHVGAGVEGGPISGAERPDGLSEYGGGVTWFGKTNKGFGVVVERVGRLSHDLPTTSETKVDAMFAMRGKHGAVVGLGAGLRMIAIAGEPDRRGSTLWGVDVFRIQGGGRIMQIGPVNLEAYFAWTFGLVHGEVYGMRTGDMPYPVRDYWTVASSYVFGLGTSFDTQP